MTDDWRTQRWQIGATVLEAGRGGIALVARMTARALIEAGARTDIFALADVAPTDISRKRAFAGSKARYAAACHAAALTHDFFLYDAVGPARAHPRLPGLRRPYGVWIHGVEVWNSLSPDRTRALRGAEFVLSNSQFTLDRFQGLHFELPNACVCQLATEEDAPPSILADFNGVPTVLILSRIDGGEMYKGHGELIAAWPDVVSRVSKARLVIAGGGSGLDEVRRLASQSAASGSIDVLGFVPNKKLEELWRAAHVFAMPSLGEGFGLVYVEAMRHGLPIVTSNKDAGQELNTEGETGFCVEPSEREDLAGRLITLLSDRELCARMGRAGFAQWQQQYRASQFAHRLTECLDKLCAV